MSALGAALRLLPRPDRSACELDDLLAAAHRLCAAGRPGLHLAVDDGRRPSLLVEEDERSHRTDLLDLADDLTRARVETGPAALDAVLAGWLEQRPVPDAEAARRGIAVLTWSDPAQQQLGWQVTVQRRGGLVGWTPHPFTPVADLLTIRDAALLRAADVVVRCTVEGPVLLLDADEPLLATAALSAPEQVLARAAALGLPLGDGRVVVTPGRPVAWTAPFVAGRLAGESVEPCAVLPWRAIPDLPWV